MRVMIDDGWEGTGKKGKIIGNNVFIFTRGIEFTPVLWDDGQDVDLVMLESLCIVVEDKEQCRHKSQFIKVEVCPDCAEVLSDVPAILGIPKKNPLKVRCQ